MESSKQTVTSGIGEFVVNYQSGHFSPEDWAMMKTAFTDWVCVALAGSREESIQKLTSVMKTQCENGTSSLVGRKDKTSSLWAALVNGTSAHAQDFDDVHDFLSMHMTVPVCSAALTAAEQVHASGKEFLTAAAAGMQMMAGIAAAIMPEHYQNLWHATATVGVFGSAAACGKLYRLTPEQMCHAFGIAASKSSGIQANFGSMTKPMQPAQASRNGLEAVLLAREGFTACTEIFDSPYLSMISGRAEKEKILPRMKGSLAVHELRYKRFPCGAPTHSGILNAFAIVKEHHITADDIQRIVLEPYPRAIRLAGTSHPETGLAGKFSLPFCTAAAIVYGKISLETFQDSVLEDPRIQRLLSLIELVPNETYSPSRGGKATFYLKDGRVLTNEVFLLGKQVDPEKQKQDVHEKYLEIAPGILSSGQAEQLWDLLQNLEGCKDMTELTALLN